MGLHRPLGDHQAVGDGANAPTRELVMAPDGSFYFLEVNTRLQVEHPVTELVTGIDLVRAQLLVAAGEPLPREMLDAAPHGHAIEVRLYAEDVAAGFIPVAGRLQTLEFPDPPGIRIDAGFESGSVISTFYDPMLAKVIGYGHTRDEDCARVARGLTETRGARRGDQPRPVDRDSARAGIPLRGYRYRLSRAARPGGADGDLRRRRQLGSARVGGRACRTG
jgi:Biotin carboxylase C-terminal domain/Carbamoyl-phosphate synthase L chain, ATP binding domain